MEEKILEILNGELTVEYGSTKECAKEIATLYREFIEWFYYKFRHEIPLIEDDIVSWAMYDGYYNLDELFEYWITNIKNK
jgi:hypothetical protein